MSSPAASTQYHLVRPHAEVAVPRLDEHQQRVVDHEGGPLLVLAGPGTGKTTTLVEAIVDRIEQRGAAPDSVLALTFSRKAAEQLRDRVTARLGRTTSTQLSSTFHSFAYGLIRQYSPPELYAAPLRLLSAPEQDVVLQGLLTDSPESVHWPDSLRRAVGTRGFAAEVQSVLARAREKGLDGPSLQKLGIEADLAGVRRRRALPRPVPRRARRAERDRLRRPDPAGGDRGRGAPPRAAGPVQPRLRRRVPGHRPRPGRAAARAGRRRRQPHGRRRPAPVDLRLPRRRGARHPRVPDRLPPPRRPPRRRGRAAHHAPVRTARAAGLPAGRPAAQPDGIHRRGRPPRLPRAGRRAERPRRRPGRGAHLRHRARRGRAPRRPAAPGPPRGRRGVVGHGGAGALRAGPASPRCAAR